MDRRTEDHSHTVTGRDYLEALYRVVLKRPPDAKGLEYWSKEIESGRSRAEVFEAFVTSNECRQLTRREAQVEAARSVIVQALRASRCGCPIVIVDVGAQVLAGEDHIYQPLVACGLPCNIVGFEPLAHRLLERAEKESGTSLTLLPYAIGDGKTHTLNVNSDVTQAQREMQSFVEGYYGAPYEVLSRQQGLCAGTVESCTAWLNAFVAAGAQTLVLRFGGPDQFGQLERCVRDVLPQVRVAAGRR